MILWTTLELLAAVLNAWNRLRAALAQWISAGSLWTVCVQTSLHSALPHPASLTVYGSGHTGWKGVPFPPLCVLRLFSKVGASSFPSMKLWLKLWSLSNIYKILLSAWLWQWASTGIISIGKSKGGIDTCKQLVPSSVQLTHTLYLLFTKLHFTFALIHCFLW